MKKSILFPYHPLVKWIGLILILFSATGLIWRYLSHQPGSTEIPQQLISLGLIFIFFSKEKIEDERIHQWKFHSLSWGTLTAFFLMMVLQYFSIKMFANSYIILDLSLSIVSFYIMKARN